MNWHKDRDRALHSSIDKRKMTKGNAKKRKTNHFLVFWFWHQKHFLVLKQITYLRLFWFLITIKLRIIQRYPVRQPSNVDCMLFLNFSSPLKDLINYFSCHFPCWTNSYLSPDLKNTCVQPVFVPAQTCVDLRPELDPACLVCGDQENRVQVSVTPMKQPSV